MNPLITKEWLVAADQNTSKIFGKRFPDGLLLTSENILLLEREIGFDTCYIMSILIPNYREMAKRNLKFYNNRIKQGMDKYEEQTEYRKRRAKMVEKYMKGLI